MPSYDQQLLRYAFFVYFRSQGLSLAEIGDLYAITRQAVRARIIRGAPIEQPPIHAAFLTLPFHHRKGRGRARALVRHRDNYTCQDCGLQRTPEQVSAFNSKKSTAKGKIKSLDVHHINGLCGKKTRAYDSTTDLSNMITLCHKCHYNRHDHRKYGKYRTIHNS